MEVSGGSRLVRADDPDHCDGASGASSCLSVGEPMNIKESNVKTLKVFDPTISTPSDQWGSDSNPKENQLVCDLNYVKDRDVKVRRFNLRDHPQSFTDHPEVLAKMGEEGQFLPIFLIDDKLVCRGAYPSVEKLTEWLGLDAPTAIVSPEFG